MLSRSNAPATRMSLICSARHGDGARVVVDCRCSMALTHWPWVAGVAEPKSPMVGRFAGCCASAVRGRAARDGGRLLRCGISASLMPASGQVQKDFLCPEQVRFLVSCSLADVWSLNPFFGEIGLDRDGFPIGPVQCQSAPRDTR